MYDMSENKRKFYIYRNRTMLCCCKSKSIGINRGAYVAYTGLKHLGNSVLDLRSITILRDDYRAWEADKVCSLESSAVFVSQGFPLEFDGRPKNRHLFGATMPFLLLIF